LIQMAGRDAVIARGDFDSHSSQACLMIG
jgi:hypothetical protein